jgi:tetratricopeptide (TPR) repeat protein
VLEDRPVAAVSSFKKAKRLQEDPDARLLIGKQLAIAEDFPGAEAEYQAALADPSIGDKPATKPEAHRSMAEIYMQRNRPGLARGQLALALELDGPLRDYLGLAKTEELLGDLYAPRPLNRNAAEQAYEDAIENFTRAGDAQRARNVRGKLRKLRAEAEPIRDGWLTRLLDRCAQALVKAVERRRGRPGRKED